MLSFHSCNYGVFMGWYIAVRGRTASAGVADVTLPVSRGRSYLKDIDQDNAAHIAFHYHQLEY